MSKTQAFFDKKFLDLFRYLDPHQKLMGSVYVPDNKR